MEGWKISQEQELALLLAGTATRREACAGRIAALHGTADPAAFREIAHQQRMAPLLEERLRAAGHDPARFSLLSPDERREGDLRALRFRGVSDLITNRLETAGIPVLPLKGVGLAKRLYGDDAMRSVSDVDFLIRADQLDAAVHLSRELGYRLVDGALDELPRLHLVLAHETARLPRLEVHWRVHWYERRFAEHVLMRSCGAGAARIPLAVDELGMLLLFYQRDGFTGLRLACDVGAWWDRHGSEVPAGAITTLAKTYPQLAAAWTAAALTAHRVVGVPADHLLAATRERTRRVGLAVGLANWALLGDRDQIGADVTLIDGLCSPSNQLADFAHRSLIVSDAQLSRYYKVPGDARIPLLALRVFHPLKLGLRYLLALSRLVRRSTRQALGARGSGQPVSSWR